MRDPYAHDPLERAQGGVSAALGSSPLATSSC